MGCRFLLQGIFTTQGSNLHLLHCRRIHYSWTTREAPDSTQALHWVRRLILGGSSDLLSLSIQIFISSRNTRIDSVRAMISNGAPHGLVKLTHKISRNTFWMKSPILGLTPNKMRRKDAVTSAPFVTSKYCWKLFPSLSPNSSFAISSFCLHDWFVVQSSFIGNVSGIAFKRLWPHFLAHFWPQRLLWKEESYDPYQAGVLS